MKYIALLRGINVGGNHKVEMKKLKLVFESMGYTNVSTYINSGNIFFESASNAKEDSAKIQSKLKSAFGFDIPIVILDQKTIQKIAKAIPPEWKNDTDQRTDILFLFKEFDRKKTLDIIKRKEGVDSLIYVPGAIAWNLHRKHLAQSGMRKLIGTPLYKNATIRNVNSLRTFVERMKK